MAINVTNVRSVAQGISNMSYAGSKAAISISKISTELKDFNKVWKGGSYERVANSYDGIVDDFNNLIQYITTQVPDTINSAMAFMASVNEVSYSAADITTAQLIEKVNAKNEEAMFMYDRASFEHKKNEITTLIRESRQQIRTVLDEVNGGAFRNGFGENDSTYSAIKSSVGTMVENVTNDIEVFERAFNSALDDISNKEQRGEQEAVDSINSIK